MKLVPVCSIFNERFIMNTKSAADVIGSAVASLDSSIRDAKTRRALLKSGKTRAMLETLLTPIMWLIGDIGMVRVELYLSKPCVYVTLFELDSLKQRELMSLLGYLYDESHKLEGKLSTQDWAAAVNRDYKFVTSKWEVSVSAYVKENSPTCRRVVVGTEMIEKTEYQIVCD
jgi:hypothetical protein